MVINNKNLTESIFSEIIKLYNVFNAFVCGKGSINGSILPTPQMDKEKCVPETILSFWKKVTTIEEIYDFEFEKPHRMSERDSIWINAMYNSLAENRATKSMCHYTSIEGKGKIPKQLSENIKNRTKMCLITSGSINTQILDHNFDFFYCEGIFDFKAVSVVYHDSNEYTVSINDADNSEMFKSIIFF